jgi:hypothetical protein
MACAKHRSSEEMIRRYKGLVKDGALIVTRPHRSSINFLLDGNENDDIYHVHQRASFPPQPPNGNSPTDRTIETQVEEDMEVHDQPASGWTVDIGQGTCSCRTWASFGYCVHLYRNTGLSRRQL